MANQDSHLSNSTQHSPPAKAHKHLTTAASGCPTSGGAALPSVGPVSWFLFLFQKCCSNVFCFFSGSYHEKYGNDTRDTGQCVMAWVGLVWCVRVFMDVIEGSPENMGGVPTAVYLLSPFRRCPLLEDPPATPPHRGHLKWKSQGNVFLNHLDKEKMTRYHIL